MFLTAFSTIVAWVPVPFGFRWSLPADSRSYEGLGGGIAWALDPAFCEQLLPSFHEDAHPVPALHAVDGATDESTAACTAHEVLFTAKHDRADAHALAPRRSLRHPAAVSAEPLAC